MVSGVKGAKADCTRAILSEVEVANLGCRDEDASSLVAHDGEDTTFCGQRRAQCLFNVVTRRFRLDGDFSSEIADADLDLHTTNLPGRPTEVDSTVGCRAQSRSSSLIKATEMLSRPPCSLAQSTSRELIKAALWFTGCRVASRRTPARVSGSEA